MHPVDAPAAPDGTLYRSDIEGLKRIHEGKVRDIYEVDEKHLLIVTTDRLSAFDVVLPNPIPDKGRVLTQISNFWFGRTGAIVRNHLSDRTLAKVVKRREDLALLRDRAVIVRRLKALPFEAVVRGYLIGSGWKDYQRSGAVCGIELPQGLQLAARLPQPIFTPATKAPAGKHDENIGFEVVVDRIGKSLATKLRDTALRLYRFAADYALERGIIIADTKFEFGTDTAGRLVLIDEALTPDSSRFWPLDTWREGASPESFDKQYVRNWLDSIGFDRKPPAPAMPPEVARRTSEKYQEAARRLIG
ncbi:MAG: phosphoribosylaminoimidazolesuccinocarboxamide synthase [Steroidobacteraceae bacterium]